VGSSFNMMYLWSAAFLVCAAASFSGWGGLVMPHSDSWSRRFGAGTLLVFLLVSSAGWSGWLTRGVLWAVLSTGMLLLLRPGAVRLPRGAGWIALAGLLVLPLALLPPISRDAMSHHLLLPRIWLTDGAISQPEWLRFFSYPYLVETLYAVCGGTVGFDSSQMISLLGFMAVCSVPVEYFLRKGSRKTALLSLVILTSVPELFRNASWSYSDTFLTFFSVLAYVEILREDGSPVLSVLWAGAAGCCKYNGLLVLLVVAAALPFRFGRMSFRTWITCGLAALLTSAWWAVPNLVQWGNPVYPLLKGFFGNSTELSARGTAYLAANATFSPAISGMADYLLLPVKLSLYGEWDNPALFDGASGPLLLGGALLAVALAGRRRRKLLPPLAFLVLAVAFSGTAVRTRYLLPGLAMLAVPAAEAVSTALSSGGRMVRAVTATLLAGCLVWSVLAVTELYQLERPWTLPGREEYLAANTDYYTFYRECTPFVTDTDTTLLINMDRPFYYPGNVITGSFRLPVELLDMFWTGMSADAVLDSLAGQGVTLLAMDMVYTALNLLPELHGEELLQWREFTARGLIPVVSTDRYMLFRLRNGP
jgi:hypothetical protein